MDSALIYSAVFIAFFNYFSKLFVHDLKIHLSSISFPINYLLTILSVDRTSSEDWQSINKTTNKSVNQYHEVHILS